MIELDDIPSFDDVPTPAHGFIVDPLTNSDGVVFYAYLRDPTMPLEGGNVACVGRVTISTGAEPWQWWVDGYPYNDPRARGESPSIEAAATAAWPAWQSAPRGKTRPRLKGET